MAREESKSWDILMASIHRAAHILGDTLFEEDMPDYGNWFVARRMHKDLWGLVYARSRKRRSK